MITQTNKNKSFLSVDEVASLFTVKPSTVREWARLGEVPAKKIGKQWFFPYTQLLEYQSFFDAEKVLKKEVLLSHKRSFDIFVDNTRVEVKSTGMKTGQDRGFYWYFTNFHPAKHSDFYLLLAYNRERTRLLLAFYIPSSVLEKKLPEIMSQKNNPKKKSSNVESELDGKNFIISPFDSFFHEYVIYNDLTI